jgi:hypothetical protein
MSRHWQVPAVPVVIEFDAAAVETMARLVARAEAVRFDAEGADSWVWWTAYRVVETAARRHVESGGRKKPCAYRGDFIEEHVHWLETPQEAADEFRHEDRRLNPPGTAPAVSLRLELTPSREAEFRALQAGLGLDSPSQTARFVLAYYGDLLAELETERAHGPGRYIDIRSTRDPWGERYWRFRADNFPRAGLMRRAAVKAWRLAFSKGKGGTADAGPGNTAPTPRP